MYDYAGLNARLLADAPALLSQWLPGGRFAGHEYVCAGLLGGPGGSLSINKLNGRWAEFNGQARGGDLVSLYAAVRGITQGEAYRQLGGEEAPVRRTNGAHHAIDEEEVHMQTPPNVDFQPSMFNHREDGNPSALWVYRDAAGAPTHVVARYDLEGGKEIRPWIFDGLRWKNKAPPKPRPLYGLDRLAASDRPVLLVEGEKTADAAALYFPKRPCMTWMGGVGGVNSADWSPLAGREVAIWPDNDDAGIKAAARICEKLLQLGCEVRRVDPTGWPEKWDLADGMAAGTQRVDILEYARAHTTAVAPPSETPAPAPLPKVQKSPPPGTQTLEQSPAPGSLVETWQRHGFICRSTGRPYSNYSNVGAAIRARGDLDVFYDEFSQRVMVGEEEWSAHATRTLAIWLQRRMGLSEVTLRTVHEGVLAYAWEHRRNPLKTWLEGLVWDNTPRLAEMMHTGMGAAQSDYSAQVGRCFFIGMVARVMEPGCKADCMPVFEGEQGIKKSTALKIIGGPYFVEIHENVNHKDFYLALTGKLLGEISEMEAFSRADIKKVKGILSTRTDTYRAPYDPASADHPRTCLFAGTTNLNDWNTDETGARRFWPLHCGEVNTEWVEEHRTQLFAEAVYRYRDGEDWWSIPEGAAEMQRQASREVDPWEEGILHYIEGRTFVTTHNILTLHLDIQERDIKIVDEKRVAKVLRQNRYRSVITKEDGRSQRRWVKRSMGYGI